MFSDEDFSILSSFDWSSTSNDIESIDEYEFLRECLTIISEEEPQDEPNQKQRRKSSKNQAKSMMATKKPRVKSSRKPSFRPEFMPDIRVLKSDIRRRYGEMYTNVVNGQDPKLVQDFFSLVCLPDCSFKNVFLNGCKLAEFLISLYVPDTELEPPRKGAGGAAAIAQGLILSQELIQDGCVRLLNFEVHVTRGVPGSRLVGKLLYTGTLLYDVIHSPRQLVANPDDQALIGFLGPNPMSRDMSLALKKEPVPLQIISELVLNLDDNYHINGIQISTITSD